MFILVGHSFARGRENFQQRLGIPAEWMKQIARKQDMEDLAKRMTGKIGAS
jgi:hypothetical protein